MPGPDLNLWRLEAEAIAATAAFRRRVDASRRVIERAVQVGRVAFSVSWGKDSTAMGGLALEVLGRESQLIHLRSPYALPGHEEVERFFAARCSLSVVPYRRSLEEYLSWLADVGLPHERTAHHSGAAHGKARLAVDWAEEHGLSVQAMGLRADESGTRKAVLRHRGALYQRKDGNWTAWPIGWWSSSDVWAFIASRNLPYHPMYDCETHGYTRHTIRNAGWLTTNNPGRLPWLRAHFPEQFRQLEEAFPRVRQFT